MGIKIKSKFCGNFSRLQLVLLFTGLLVGIFGITSIGSAYGVHLDIAAELFEVNESNVLPDGSFNATTSVVNVGHEPILNYSTGVFATQNFNDFNVTGCTIDNATPCDFTNFLGGAFTESIDLNPGDRVTITWEFKVAANATLGPSEFGADVFAVGDSNSTNDEIIIPGPQITQVVFNLADYTIGDTVVITVVDGALNTNPNGTEVYTPSNDTSTINFPNGNTLSMVMSSGPWIAPPPITCFNPRTFQPLEEITNNTGLVQSGFKLTEKNANSSVFEGDFIIPTQFCPDGASITEPTSGGSMNLNYSNTVSQNVNANIVDGRPQTPIITEPVFDSVLNTLNITASGTADPGVNILIELEDINLSEVVDQQTVVSDGNGDWTASLIAPSDGEYAIFVIAENRITGEQSPDLDLVAFTVDITTITINKNATGGEGTFDFTVNGPTALSPSITTVGGSGTSGPHNVVAGIYNITETGMPNLWALASATCTDEFGSSPFDPDLFTVLEGDDITCTFDNIKNATITIIKNATGGDGTFEFDVTEETTGDKTIARINTAESNTTGPISTQSGNVTVTEILPDNWQVFAATCNTPGEIVDSQRTVVRNVTVTPGDDITCTFGNVKDPTITINKNATGGDGTFEFDVTEETTGQKTIARINTAESNTTGPTSIQSGNVTVTEILPDGWQAVFATCNTPGEIVNSQRTVVRNVTVTPREPGEDNEGSDITCQFDNIKNSTLKITKLTTGGDGTFNFTVTGPTPSTPSITTVGGMGMDGPKKVDPGKYNITETLPAGWIPFKAATCDAGSATGSNTTVTNLIIKQGDEVTCTFENEMLLVITILNVTKIVTTDNGGTAVPGDFTMIVNGSNPIPAIFPGNSNGTLVIIGPGQYNVTETGLLGYNATFSADCDGIINAGEIKNCLVTNDDVPAEITVIKRIVNDDGGTLTLAGVTLTVDGNPVTNGTANSVSADTHTVDEDAIAGYTKTISGDCDNTGSVTVGLGEAITCTITNDDVPATLKIIKNTEGGDGTFDYEITDETTGDVIPLDVTTVGETGESNTIAVLPGTYSIQEFIPLNWILTAASCTDGSSTSNGPTVSRIVINTGEAVECTFGNAKLGEIHGEKYNDLNNNGINDLGEPALEGWKIQLLDSDGLVIDNATTASAGADDGVFWFMDLLPGNYTVREILKPGWIQTEPGAPDFEHTVNLQPGEIVNLEFGNIMADTTLTVNKVVNNTGGGTLTTDDFTLSIDGNEVILGESNIVSAGIHIVSETDDPNYIATFSGDCDSGGIVDIPVGQSSVCTITNTFVPTILIIKKSTLDGFGGTFTFVSGQGPSDGDITGTQLTTTSPTFMNSTSISVEAGDYLLGEIPQPILWNQVSAVCTDITDPQNPQVISNNPDVIPFNIPPGSIVQCEFTNQRTGTLEITKVNEGIEQATFRFVIDPTTPDLSPQVTQQKDVLPATEVSFAVIRIAGLYDVAEPTAFIPSEFKLIDLRCDSGTVDTTDPIDTIFDVEVLPGQTTTCTFVNTNAAEITLIKRIINDDGGTLTLAGVNLTVDGNPVTNGTANSVSADTHTVDEDAIAGYTKTISGGCDDTGSVTVGLGDTITCTITNDDVPATLKITKLTTGGDGPFDFAVTGPTPSTPSITTVGGMGMGAKIFVLPGTYSIQEIIPDGWILTDASCTDGSSILSGGAVSGIVIDLGDNIECTFENTKSGSIIIIKDTIPDDPQVFDYTSTLGTFSLDDDIGTALSNIIIFVNQVPGVFTVTEVAVAGFDLTAISCVDPDGSTTVNIGTRTAMIDLGPGEDIICLFENTKEATITVIKRIVNDDGGTLTLAGVTLTVDGNPVTNGTANSVSADIHTVDEDAIAGYTKTISGDCDDTGSVTVGLGETITCTITNDDNPAEITLIKEVINNNGGTAGVDDFGLSIDGVPVNSGDTLEVNANDPSIVLDEAGLVGYTDVGISGDAKCPSVIGGTVVPLDVGEAITCTITNDDVPAEITVIKRIVNDDGGTLTLAGVTLTVDGNPVTNGTANSVSADIHTVDEDAIAGYTKTISGDCDDTGSVTVGLGETITCTITNDDVPVSTTLNIDIKPGSFPNSINLGEQGNLPVVIFGSFDFDVLIIDTGTMEIGGAGLAERGSPKAPKLAFSIEDVNFDGIDDLMVHFSVQDIIDAGALTVDTTELEITALLNDGTPISGVDSVRVVPPDT